MRHHMHSIRAVEAYLPAVRTSRRSFAERTSTEQAMTGLLNCRHGAFKTGVGEVSTGLQGGRSLMMSPLFQHCMVGGEGGASSAALPIARPSTAIDAHVPAAARRHAACYQDAWYSSRAL